MSAQNKQCKAHAMSNSEYCFTHNPETREMHLQASSIGGSVSKEKVSLPEHKIEACEDIVGLLIETINQVRAGEIDTKVANCIGFLSGHLVKIYEATKLEDRLQTIESLAKEYQPLAKAAMDLRKLSDEELEQMI